MKQVLILGNGISRKRVRSYIQNWKFELWACNWAYKEAVQYNIDRIYSVHSEVIKEAYKFRRHYKLSYRIVSKKSDETELADQYFKKTLGWSTGNLAIVDALEEKFDKILLAGFDFGGSDIYQSHQLPGGNFFKQFTEILRKYGEDKLFFLRDGNILSVSDMRRAKVNSFWASMDNKDINPKKKIPYFFPTVDQRFGRTLVIGNSPNVLNQDFGETINSFDTVTRINDYITDGYEKQIGTKTDIWFTGASKVARKRSEFDMIGVIPILGLSSSRLHMNENDKIRGKLFQDLKETFDIPLHRYKAIPFDMLTQIKHKLKMNSPTTGFLALYYFIEYLKFSNVTVHGFDFFDTPYHYYDEDKVMKTKLSIAHEYDKEKEIVLRWKKEGKISCLEDVSHQVPLTKEVKNIFIFGTSPYLDSIDFEKIKHSQSSKDIITAGVNRIFYKFQPDYFFFMDRDIIEELSKNSIQREEHSKWMIPKFLYENSESRVERGDFQSYIDQQKIEELNINFFEALKRKSSMLWLLYYFQEILFKDYLCKFFLIGVELKTDKGHYFGGKYNSNRPNLGTQYVSQQHGIKELSNLGYKIMSLTPNSKLHEFIPFIDMKPEKFIEENF